MEDTLQASRLSDGSRREEFSNSKGFPEGGEYRVLNKLPTKEAGMRPDLAAAPGCSEHLEQLVEGGRGSAGLLQGTMDS